MIQFIEVLSSRRDFLTECLTWRHLKEMWMSECGCIYINIQEMLFGSLLVPYRGINSPERTCLKAAADAKLS